VASSRSSPPLAWRTRLGEVLHRLARMHAGPLGQDGGDVQACSVALQHAVGDEHLTRPFANTESSAAVPSRQTPVQALATERDRPFQPHTGRVQLPRRSARRPGRHKECWPCNSNSVRLSSAPRAPTRVGGLRAFGRDSGRRASSTSLLHVLFSSASRASLTAFRQCSRTSSERARGLTRPHGFASIGEFRLATSSVGGRAWIAQAE
jgi:hypothetical protein